MPYKNNNIHRSTYKLSNLFLQYYNKKKAISLLYYKVYKNYKLHLPYALFFSPNGVK